MKARLLAIDPGYRELGMAFFIGQELEDYSVKSLRRPNRNGFRILSLMLTRIMEEKRPTVLTLEKNNFQNLPQNKLVVKVVGRIKKAAETHGLPVYEFAPGTIKKAVAGDGRATKRELSKTVSLLFPYLRLYRDTGKKGKDRYHQNMFDAIAVGLTYFKFKSEKTIQNYESDR